MSHAMLSNGEAQYLEAPTLEISSLLDEIVVASADVKPIALDTLTRTDRKAPTLREIAARLMGRECTVTRDRRIMLNPLMLSALDQSLNKFWATVEPKNTPKPTQYIDGETFAEKKARLMKFYASKPTPVVGHIARPRPATTADYKPRTGRSICSVCWGPGCTIGPMTNS